MSSMEKPIIFLITGAWHVPEHFTLLTKALEEHGFDAVSYRNRTNIVVPKDQLTPESPETKLTIYDDAEFFRPKLAELVEAGRRVFVTGHSYGGSIMSETVTEDLTLKSRTAKGLKGGVGGLMFICAFMFRKGDTIGLYHPTNVNVTASGARTSADQDGSGIESFAVPNPDMGALEVSRPDLFFYNDLQPEEQKHAASRLIPFSAVSSQPLTNVAQMYTPTTYILCSNDNALRIEIQRKMIAAMKEDGVVVREVSCDSSHSPFLSKPKWLAGEIASAVGWSGNQSIG